MALEKTWRPNSRETPEGVLDAAPVPWAVHHCAEIRWTEDTGRAPRALAAPSVLNLGLFSLLFHVSQQLRPLKGRLSTFGDSTELGVENKPKGWIRSKGGI